jgi:hypothetical protein
MTALVLLPLMAMLALTIDIGYAWGQRRLAQNVADSGAVAATSVIAERLLGASRTDGDVRTAVRNVARNSSGAFVSSTSDFFVGVYVADSNGDGVPEEMAPQVQVGSAMGGAIPSEARGVRLIPGKANPTFFAAVLGANSLVAGARATALARDVVGSSQWAPYAVWGGELAHRCRWDPFPPPLSEIPAWTPWFQVDDEPGGDPSKPFKIDRYGNYVYGCIPLYNGTEATSGGLKPECWTATGPAPLGCSSTRVIYHSSQYRQPNVYNGDQADTRGEVRWDTTSSSFKGFFHVDNDYLDVREPATYDSGGGVAEGSSTREELRRCWLQNQQTPDSCLVLMPIVSKATGTGNVSLTVSGFALVRLDDPNANDRAAYLVQAALSTREAKAGVCSTGGRPCLKVVRLVQ